VLIPIGSTEQHGPQCPLGTDFIIAETLAREAARRSDVLCTPTIPFGVAAHHQNFKGTIFIKEPVFKYYIKDVVNSLIFHGAKKIILVNGHGGNTSALQSIISEIRRGNPTIAILLFEYFKNLEIVQAVFGEGTSLTHACGIETSMINACRAGTVDMDLAKTLDVPKIWGIPVAGQIMPGTTDEFSKLGPVGDMQLTSDEKGRELKFLFVNHLCEIIQDLSQFDSGNLDR
ncbi:MAG: creatininase family protein, partial [Candidatus Kariarchaeaceae archaeon]